MTRRRAGLLVAALAALVARPAAQAPTQPPVFRSAVEVTSIDATVVDGASRPITDLGAGEFTVDVDGRPRRVVSADWVSMLPDANAAPPPPLPEGYSSNEGGTAGRLIVLVVDQPNIRFGGGQMTAEGRGRVPRHAPARRSRRRGRLRHGRALDGVPGRTASDLKAAIATMHGQMEAATAGSITATHMSLAEALAIERGDEQVLQSVDRARVRRWRRRRRGGARRPTICPSSVRDDARDIARTARERRAPRRSAACGSC